MLEIASGNLLEAEVDALVNTVNCVGYMGKGIALQFKRAFPDNFRVYERACKAKEVAPGKMLVVPTGNIQGLGPRFIINFPTKEHWKGNSKIQFIDSGLVALIDEVQRLGITSIAVPPLGCGLGGLDWNDVRPRIEQAFATVPNVRVLLYAPAGAPSAHAMPIRTLKPKMTIARALCLKLMAEYSAMAYQLTLLEIQKLAYFLQEYAKEPLKLAYQKGIYGPYADNLNKVFETLEGHYTRGLGDNFDPNQEIELLPGAEQAADVVLANHSEASQRLRHVCELIAGFENPHGMELLSSVHWVAVRNQPPAKNIDDAIQAVQTWNDRKRRVLLPKHIEIAWRRLVEFGALRPTNTREFS